MLQNTKNWHFSSIVNENFVKNFVKHVGNEINSIHGQGVRLTCNRWLIAYLSYLLFVWILDATFRNIYFNLFPCSSKQAL